jgi:hypothetical protein
MQLFRSLAGIEPAPTHEYRKKNRIVMWYKCRFLIRQFELKNEGTPNHPEWRNTKCFPCRKKRIIRASRWDVARLVRKSSNISSAWMTLSCTENHLVKVRLHAAINRADLRFCRMLMTECCHLTMSSDNVDSLFFKYHLIKAEPARLIAACKRTLIDL